MHNSTGVNRVLLVGNIETAPKRHENGQGHARLVFSLTTTEAIRNGRQQFEHVELHHLVINADHADVKDLTLVKGARLYVVGKAQTRAWTDVANIKRYKTEIWVSQLQLL